MIISRYGVKLIRLRREHLELIRYWRNSSKIRSVMEYQEFITQKMQSQWFNSLNLLNDFYFVIEYEGNLVGLIHASNVDWQQRTAQSGLFIWEDAYHGSPVPIMASVNLLDTFFDFFCLEELKAKVKHDNFIALTYNKFIGFEEIQPEQKKEFISIVLTKDNYANQSGIIKYHFDDNQLSKLNIQIKNEDLNKFEEADIKVALSPAFCDVQMVG
jgi:RimJ/RimL family protein N-acetyltransferase